MASVAVASALVVAVALTVGLTLVLPRLTGGAALTVLSGSMSPTLPVGSTVIVRPVDAADVEPGDIITFANLSGRSFTTHRVEAVEITSEGRHFITKGDANRRPDVDPVRESALRGRVWFHVPYVGQLRDIVATPWGLGTVIALAALTAAWERIAAGVRRRVPLPAGSRSEPALLASPDSAPEHARERQHDPTPSRHDSLPREAGTTLASDAGSAESLLVPDATVELRPAARIEQQFLLAHLNAGVFERGNVLEILGLVRGQVVAFGPRHMVVSVSGTTEHLDGVERLLRPFGLVEARRSHVVHVGGEPTPDTDAGEAGDSSTGSAKTFSALVLGPPPPPNFAFTGAPANGRSRERPDQ